MRSIAENKNVSKKLLITGCGRSGTKYTTYILKRLGLDVGHERMGDDGIASWAMAVNSASTPWGPGRNSYDFKHVFHQVRHPLSSISSIETFKPESWRYICAYIPCALDEPERLRAAKYWFYWNSEVEKFAHWRYRIEDFAVIFDEFCKRIAFQTDLNVLHDVPLNVNTRKLGRIFHWYQELCERMRLQPSEAVSHLLMTCMPAEQKQHQPCTWKSLQALDSNLSEKIQIKAEQYGYLS